MPAEAGLEVRIAAVDGEEPLVLSVAGDDADVHVGVAVGHPDLRPGTAAWLALEVGRVHALVVEARPWE